MKVRQSSGLIILLMLFVSFVINAQTVKELTDENKVLPLTKLYLHFDRDFYFQNEDVWFKAYMIDGVSHQRMAGSQNVYLDIMDKEGNIVLSKMYLLTDGLAAGSFIVPKDVVPGQYLIRAYTDYSVRLGDKGIFYKKLTFTKVKNFAGFEQRMQEAKSKVAEVVFLPEGGFLLTDEPNVVAFKMLNEKGQAINGELSVVDELGNEVLKTVTIHNGKGKFLLVPKNGKRYFGKVKDQMVFSQEITRIRKNGSKIQISGYNEEKLAVEVISKTDRTDSSAFYLACMHRGNLIFYHELKTKEGFALAEIDANVLQSGINRLLFLNADFKPLSERLVFSNRVEVNKIRINNVQKEYGTREKVMLVLNDSLSSTENNYSNLSVAVVDENSLSKSDMNILSWAMLDSELHNFNENSLGYFNDEMGVRSRINMDLLMLTHGWSNYIWNDTTAMRKEDRKFTAGITIKGHNKRVFKNEPVPNATVIMQVYTKNDVNFHSQATDSAGRFAFENLYFCDSAKILVQSKNKRRKNAGELFLDMADHEKPYTDLNWINSLENMLDVPNGLYRQKYAIEADKRAFYPDYETIMLGNVDIIGQKQAERKEEVAKLYGDPDKTLDISEQDQSFSNILEYIASNVAGVSLTESSITLRGGPASFSGGSGPLFLIDGMYFEGKDGFDMAISYNMSEISSVDVLKSGANLSIFGSRGANGVIAIYTKKGTPFQKEKVFEKGSIQTTIIGFAAYREFYAPEYTSETFDAEEPDGRLTLYWNPEVYVDSGNADIGFFTSDKTGRYRIVVEGITSDGKVCYGTRMFNVK
uniref:TonB-dependent receptor plug domain-containing protein n=1 Tax=uncultured Draconibacterium sp. TaxID=1573823 RepID=UPI003217FBDA